MEQELLEYEKYEEHFYASRKGKQNILVNIGEGCYMQAEVEGSSIKEAFVHVGLGNYVQFPDESSLIEFIEKRRNYINQKIVYLTTRSDIMRADVDQVGKLYNLDFRCFSSITLLFLFLFYII